MGAGIVTGIQSQLDALDADVRRWRDELGLVAGTHLDGIGTKAFRRLENLLKETVRTLQTSSKMPFNDLVRISGYTGAATSLEKLTLGTVLEMLNALVRDDEALSPGWRRIEPALRTVTPLRNSLIHAPTVEDLIGTVGAALDCIAVVVSETGFWKAVERRS